MTQAEQWTRLRMAAAASCDAPAAVKIQQHVGVAAAPALADALTNELNVAQEEVLRARVFMELTSSELAKV